MLSVYQNSNADDYESIKAGFIVRKPEYEAIISSLKKQKSGDSIQHELILGRRGSGKSTLLKRIEVEIEENEELKVKYITVNPAEEQAGIYRLMDLWKEVLQKLYYLNDEKYEIKKFSEFDSEQSYSRYLYGEIHHFCETKKKRVALLLDNFDRIIGSFSDDGKLLRETLMNYHDLVLITTSARMDEHFLRYDQPFYEFSRRHRLDKLNSEETRLLFEHWGDSLDFNSNEREKINDFLKNHPGKIETIRLLTDGLPRTMLLFLKLIIQTEKPLEEDFLKNVMDDVSPLYQEQLLNLTPQMRKIILEMALMWEAASTKEIAGQCEMESNLVSANLNTLADRNIVEIIATGKRNNLYRIADRSFNMWMIITQGNPDQKRKASRISEFMERWYDRQETQTIAPQPVEKLKPRKSSGKKALRISKELSRNKYVNSILQAELIDYSKAELNEAFNDFLIPLPEQLRKISNEIINFIDRENYPQAIKLVNSIENEEYGLKEYVWGLIYDNQEKYNTAEKHYLKTLKKGAESTMYNLGNLYKYQAKYDLAEKYYLMALKKGNEKAMFNLALMYYFQNINKEQVKQYIGKHEGNETVNIIIELWAGTFIAVEERAVAVCSEKKEDADFLERLLVHYQKTLVDKLFHHAEFGERLREQYTILYYVSQIINGKENENNLQLRVPPEMESTVGKVLEMIIAEQERYSK